jgi:hypothetical protein
MRRPRCPRPSWQSRQADCAASAPSWSQQRQVRTRLVSHFTLSSPNGAVLTRALRRQHSLSSGARRERQSRRRPQRRRTRTGACGDDTAGIVPEGSQIESPRTTALPRSLARTLQAPGFRIGDKEVASGEAQDTRFADVAILGSEHRDMIEIVPERYGDRAPRQFCFGRGASREAVSTRRR